MALWIGANLTRRSSGAEELVKFKRIEPKWENAKQEMETDSAECSVLATPREIAGRTTHSWSFLAAYAASFVTRECATSLVCEPTIFISRQS